LGDAVVTGFSGTLPPELGKPLPRGKSAMDLTFINPDGPSVRIVDVGKPGYVWDGRLFKAPKTFDVPAKDVGQVFGVALDDAPQPNIYVAATSVFGLNIVKRGRDGQPERMKKGGPGAGWMKGQFGLDLQGGPGGIYRIDGRTGVATLFANVTLDGVPNPGPGLGNLAYDATHKQLFVSDLYTGMIHRFDLDGKELSRYDHGVTGLSAAKLAPVAFDPKNRPNIASARFDPDKPDTWGFAPAARRVWGLAVHDGRLYYSVAAGPQVWSVGIARDGGFADDPRWELDVPAQAGPLPVSDIAFSNRGAMILAQRGLIAGAYDYSAFTQAGEPRVLRFWLKDKNDPPSPSRWKLTPEEYAIGFAGEYRNSNGGVALGYGYDRAGTLDPQSCEAALWTTGQNLRNDPALASQLEPGGPLVVNGLQGSPADQVRNANAPPATSYFIDYDDTFNDPRAAGHMGSVRIYATPCAAVAQIAPVAAMTPVPIATPIGTSPKACTPTCVCPPGTQLDGKECVKIHDCPDGQVFNQALNACACPPHFRLINGVCRPEILVTPPPSCTPPMIQIQGGPCVCQDGSMPVNGHCAPPPKCDPPLVLDPLTGACKCPQGSVMQDGKCVPQVCPAPLVPGPCVNGKPIDLGVVKTGGTTPVQEPFYDFDITVTNHGDAFPGAGVITVTDVVPPNMTFNTIGGTDWTCVPNASVPAGTQITCTYTGTGVTTGQVLPVIHIDATATGNAPYPPVTNCAVVSTPSGSGYVDDNPANDKWCVTVSKPGGSMIVEKKVQNLTEGNVTGWTYPINSTCGTPSSISLPDGGTQTLNDIPIGTNCSISENTSALPVPANACPDRRMHPVWTTTYSPASVTIGTTPVSITAVNKLDCEPNDRDDGTLSVTKRLASDPRGIGSSMSFTITAHCGPPASIHTVTIPANTSSVPFNVPIGSTCTFTEVQPTLPAGCTWLPPASTSVTIQAGLNQTMVTNTYRCGVCPPPQTMNVDNICVCPNGQFPVGGACPQTPPLCPPPQVPNVDNICACPAPMLPGAILGQCICPQGTTLVNGACVPTSPPPPTCQPPLVMIPGVGCRCPRGEELVGKECVKPIVCKPPQVPNASNTGCVCPGNEVLRRGKCVEPEKPKRRIKCPRGTELKDGECVKRKREPQIEPGDVIRVLPGLIPHGGGSNPRGGGDTPGGATPGRK
jgi:hypothetical protein